MSNLTSQFFTKQLSVTGTAAPLAAVVTNCTGGIIVECLSTSSASAFIGTSTVTTGLGLELPPGASVVLPIADCSSVYAIAAAANTTTLTILGVF